MMTKELKQEILDILDNVSYWETCPEDYKLRIQEIKKQYAINGVSHQRELLIDFSKWIFSERKDVTIKMIKEDIETFLGN